MVNRTLTAPLYFDTHDTDTAILWNGGPQFTSSSNDSTSYGSKTNASGLYGPHIVGNISEFPFTHSCAYLTHKNLKGRLLFHATASHGRMEACSFYKLHDNLSA